MRVWPRGARLAAEAERGRELQVERASSDARWWAALGLAAVLVILINPIGFIGGGRDDWQYLNAARCWREFGPCLPGNHWQGRWPVFAPIAAITALAGESRSTVSLWPLLASLACLALLAMIGNRLFGRPVGWIAALLLVATPAFSIQLLEPSVEAVELAFLLGGFLAILVWIDRRSWHWPLAAGLCFGLAMQVRETAAIGVVLAAIFVALRKPKPSFSQIAAALAGLALPFVVEFAVYAVATGDPLWRRRLSAAHTLIPSSELLGPVDRERPPYFNKAYIANWRHEPGIHLHWALDGLVNLTINVVAGLSLLLVPALLLVGRRNLDPSARQAALSLYAAAVAYIAVLIYALAVDPKARMMLVPLTATTLALALITWRLKSDSPQKLLIYACWAASAFVGGIIQYAHPNANVLDPPARRWTAVLGDRIEIDENTRRHLALVPLAERLPDIGSGRDFLIHFNTVGSCRIWLGKSGFPPGSLSVVEEAPVRSFASNSSDVSGALCLLRYERRLTREEMGAAIPSGAEDQPGFVVDRSQ